MMTLRQNSLRRTVSRAALPLLALALSFAAVALVIAGKPDPGARPDTSTAIKTYSIDSYRGPMPPEGKPSDWVAPSEIVARVIVNSVDDPRWNTPSGGEPDDLFMSFIYTPYTVTVTEYFKGAGPKTLVLFNLGGTVGGTEFVTEFSDKLSAGDEGVVFLRNGGRDIDGWGINSAYIIENGIAHGEADGKTLPVDQLLAEVRDAATETPD